jgi:AcrR family transcriptional regulator
VSALESATPSASALRLVLAAERLLALHGIDGVSLRQIAVEAGSANNSAVHYHFGSKGGLIAAIFRHRLPQLLSERELLAARCDPDDLRSRLEAHFLPVLRLAESPDSHYVSFVDQLQRHTLGTPEGMLDLPPDGQRSNDGFREDLDRLLADLPEPLRQLRIAEAQALCVHAAADRERAVTASVAPVPFEIFAGSILDGMTGFLAAPVSDATRRWLGDSGPLDDRAVRLL